MKNIKAIIIIVLLCYVQNSVAQQLDIAGVTVETSITEVEKEQIINQTIALFDKYISTGHLKSEVDRDEFLNLFGFDAEIFRDFKEARNSFIFFIEPQEYVEQAAVDFAEGLSFNIQNAKLNEVIIGEDYNFEAIISFDKVFSEYRNKDGQYSYEDGLPSLQVMTISIDPYDLTSVNISKIDGDFIAKENSGNTENDLAALEPDKNNNTSTDKQQQKKKKKKKEKKKKSTGPTFNTIEQIITASITGSTGSVGLNSVTTSPFSDNLTSSWSGLPGLDVMYRRSIGGAKKIFFTLRGGFELAKIETDISSFQHTSDSDGIEIGSSVSVPSARSNSGVDNIDSTDSQAARVFIIQNDKINSSLSNATETTDLFSMHIMSGFSYKLFESGSEQSRLFLNLSGGVNFLRARSENNVTYSGDIEEGLVLPDSDLFPLAEIIENNFDPISFEGEILKAYKTNDMANINGLVSQAQNVFSYGAGIGLSYQKNFNWNYGVELGVDYYVSLNPVIGSINSDQEITGFLEGGLSDVKSNSVVEQYTTNQRLSKIAFKVGMFFYFDNQN